SGNGLADAGVVTVAGVVAVGFAVAVRPAHLVKLAFALAARGSKTSPASILSLLTKSTKRALTPLIEFEALRTLRGSRRKFA
ncbi:MAG: hypothetical protein M0Q95_21700, partial [Porticoccaceae bacterium]|nr:hypothetical protein [Porticoccaceae bacterium]